MRTQVLRGRHRGEGAVVAGLERSVASLLLSCMPAVTASLLVLAVLAAPARAAELSATQMKISVWPEYDDPRVLVINQADLDPSVQLPADVTFNIPKGAEIGMACEVDSGGGHACKPYQLVDMGDYQALTYKVDAQKKIFLEYYYDAFPAGTPERAFDFKYRPSFAVGNTTIEVQEPLRSTNFTVDLTLAQTTTDSEGLTYHIQDYANLPMDEPFPVKVSYTKSDSDPSVQPKDNGAAQSGGLPAAGAGSSNTALFIVLAVLAFGTLLIGGYKVMRPAPASSGRRGGGTRGPARSQNVRPKVSRAQASGSDRSGSGAKSGKGSRGGASDTKFCTSCGSGIRRADSFCPECGEEQG